MDALPAILMEHLDEIRALCAKHGVRRLSVFGSAVKGTFDPARSDVDFVVEFVEGVRGRTYLDLSVDLQDLLGRRVDLVERTSVRNPYFRQVLDLTERPLYDAA